MRYRGTTVFLILALLSYLPFVVGSTTGFVLAGLLFFYVAQKALPFVDVDGFRDLGLHRHRRWGLFLIGGLLIGVAFNLVVYTILASFDVIEVEFPAALRDILLASLFAFATAGFTAFAEEIIFRGYLAKMLRPRLPWTWVGMISCTLFTLYHLPQWGLPLAYWVRFFIMGVVLLLPLIMIGSLWMSVGIHLGGNFAYYLLLTELRFLQSERSVSVVASMGWVSVGVACLLLGFVSYAGRAVRLGDGRIAT